MYHRTFSRWFRQIKLQVVGVEDMDDVIDLASRAFASTEFLPWALETLKFQKKCLQAGMDDGRTLFRLQEHGQTVGVCGTHRYIWGPKSICWGSWFFIDPANRGTITAYKLALGLLRCAKEMGFRIMYVETSRNDPNYSTISSYMERFGCSLHATVPDYYNRGADMQIYSIRP